MIKGNLIQAFDFKKDKRVPHVKESRFLNGKWYVVKSGPGYSNLYEVSEFDEDGEKWLRNQQAKDEESSATS